MVAKPHKPTQNSLLAALSAPEQERLFSQLELVPMPLGKVLYESGNQLGHVYFPADCIVSLLYVMEDGASAEIAVVGNEGLVGVALFMGGETTPSRAVVQSAGFAYRLPGASIKLEFNRGGAMQELMLRYTQALLTQMAQTAVCNRHHSVDQQLCRWLLLSLDRLHSNELKMTQELIANMLGVRRSAGLRPSSRKNAAAVIRQAGPAPWTSARSGETSTPRISGVPTMPSLPISPTSRLAFASTGISNDTKLSVGKYT